MKVKTTLRKVIECGDLDNLVIKTFGKTYCFQQQDGCKSRGNEVFIISTDTSMDCYAGITSIPEEINGEKMGVSFDTWLARDPQEWNGEKEDVIFIDLFWARNFYPDPQRLLNELCKKGLIDPGEYTIEIDW